MSIKIGLVEGGLEPSNHNEAFYDSIKEKSEYERLQPIANHISQVIPTIQEVESLVSKEPAPPVPDDL